MQQPAPLLASMAELCDFFHIKTTPEAGIRAPFCLQGPSACCSGKTTCLIARLLDANGSSVYCRLYRNAAQSSCAEGFMMRDEDLLDAARRAHADHRAPLTLTLYLTQQPCHFSSSNDTNSCTENLLRWRQEVLVGVGVSRLRIAATYPYRTHWDDRCMSDDDLAQLGRRQWGGRSGSGGGSGGGWGGGRGVSGRGGGSKWGVAGRSARGGRQGGREEREASIRRARALLASAREGTAKLVSAEAAAEGISLEAFTDDDWEFILSVAEEQVAAVYARGEPPFTAGFKKVRAQLDAFTKHVFDLYRPKVAATS